jgi:phage-related protein
VKYYETTSGNIPLKKFLAQLVKEHKEDEIGQIQLYLKQLQEYGPKINEMFKAKATKKLRGKIFDLRPDNNRILFFYQNGNEYILLHGFTKTSNKTPKREIDKAEKEMKDYLKYN